MIEIEITEEMKPYIRYFEETEDADGWGEEVLFYFGKDCNLTDEEAGKAFLDFIKVSVPEELEDIVDYQKLIRKNVAEGNIVKVTSRQALKSEVGEQKAAYFYTEWVRLCSEQGA